ncbi:MAG: sialidase family protein [Candidatus Dormibacteria bacterium]
MRSRPAFAIGMLVVAALAPQSAGAGAVRFSDPVLLTQPNFGAYEPGILVDLSGNIWVTARKTNYTLPLSPDPGSTIPARSESWIWWSQDGVHFTDVPAIDAVGSDRLTFGAEGDLTVDAKNRVYFVDTNQADAHLERWTVSGPGHAVADISTPAIGSGEVVDDRPWVVAHGDGVVAYFANAGSKLLYPLGTSGTGCGPGRYAAHMSTDGGMTFDHLGCSLPDSGACRPAADPVAGSHYLYVFCSDDGGSDDVTTSPSGTGHLYAYISPDDGRTWNRVTVGTYNAGDPETTWPSLNVAPDGTVYGMFNDGDSTNTNAGNPVLASGSDTANHLRLYRSVDHGATWDTWEVTPWATGRYHYTWSNVASDGTLGIAFYYSPDSWSNSTPSAPWHVYAGTSPGWRQPFSIVSVAPDQPVSDASVGALGDFFEVAFDAQQRLNVVWTSAVTLAGVTSPADTTGQNSDIYFAREITPSASSAGGGVRGTSLAGAALPNTSMAAPNPAPLVLLLAPALVAAAARRRRGGRLRDCWPGRGVRPA